MLAPYGVLHALSRLSLPVETNHFPHVANRNDNTQLSCKCSWYLSGLVAWSTSTCEFSMPTASQSPVKFKWYSCLSTLYILSSHCVKYLTCRTIAKRKDLWAEIVLLKLSSLSEIPWSHRVVQAARPQSRTIWTDVDARCTIGVTLELSDECVVVQVPHGNIAIAATRETHFRVGWDG